MNDELVGFLQGLDDPELAALSPRLVERLFTAVLHGSAFSITVRDGAGRARALTDVGVEGRSEDGEFDDSRLRYFGGDGAELSRLQHPVHRVRTSGTREQSWVLGLLGRSERMRWYIGSTIPLEREPEGWRTLTITAEVTTLVERWREARSRAEASEALQSLAAGLLASGASEPEAVAAAARPFAERLFGDRMVMLSYVQGSELRVWPVRLQPGIDPPPVSAPAHHVRELWREDMHVNQAVDDTDIYGNIVVGAMEHPFRSIVMAPIEVAGLRRGSFSAVSLLRDAFSDIQIAAMEQAAGLLGQALEERSDRAA